MGVNIEIHCAFDKMVKIEELVPNPQNPNKHPKKQIELFAKIIEYQGWRNPIVVSKRSGMIVKGHGRLLVAKYLGLKEVPVDFQDYESEVMEYYDLTGDNRIAELSERDNKMLLNLFEELDTGELDFELSGYNEAFYRNLAHSFDEYEKNQDDIKKTNKRVKCPNCGLEIEV